MFLSYLIPSTLLFLPLSQLVRGLGFIDSIWALVLVYPSFTLPFCTWLLMGFVRTVPREIEESAQIDGCNRLQAFRLIIIPVIVPGIITAGIFAFTLTYQEYIYALTFVSASANKTISYGVTTRSHPRRRLLLGLAHVRRAHRRRPGGGDLRVQPRPLHPRPHRWRSQVISDIRDKEEFVHDRCSRDGSSSAAPPAPRRSARSAHVWLGGRPGPQAKEVRVLAWSHFVPAYDKWIDGFAEQWGVEERREGDDRPRARICRSRPRSRPRSPRSRATTSCSSWAPARRSGRASLLDVQDLADKIGKKYGGWTPLAENYGKAADGRFHSIPDFFIDFPGLYRKDLWTEVGMPNGPETWEDLHKGGMKLKAKGFPIGIGLAHHDDSRASWRAIMWSFGGSEVAKDGKTITYNSKEVREALKFNKALYKDAMTPEVLAWDDASNNRLLASGRGSWIHNPISAYRTIEGQNKELADKIWVQLSPKGPAVRRSFANCRAYGVTKFSKNPDGVQGVPRGARRQLQGRLQGEHGLRHAVPPATTRRGRYPIISEDPKLKPLEQDTEYHFTTGYPGPLTVPADEVYQQFVMVDALAQFCTDKMDLEQTVKWGEDKIKAIYAKSA